MAEGIVANVYLELGCGQEQRLVFESLLRYQRSLEKNAMRFKRLEMSDEVERAKGRMTGCVIDPLTAESSKTYTQITTAIIKLMPSIPIGQMKGVALTYSEPLPTVHRCATVGLESPVFAI